MKFFNLSALIASLMVLAIAVVLTPDKSWSAAAITSAGIFALSVGFIFYAPSVIAKKQSGNDAAQMASLAPLGMISAALPLLTASAFVFALFDMQKLAWAMDIAAVGLFIISVLMLRVATDVIGNVASQYSAPSKHISWQGEIQSLRSIASDTESKFSLEELAEKFRYAASDVPGGSPQDSSIDHAVRDLSDQLATDSAANLQSQISKIEMLIAQRDVFLRANRSKS